VLGALWMCGAACSFALMVNLVRHLTASLDPLQVVFFRTAFGLLAMLPWLIGRGPAVLRTRRLGLHLLRAAIGIVAMVCWFTTRRARWPPSNTPSCRSRRSTASPCSPRCRTSTPCSAPP
jgi:drug/metabolite transporter (DMT)-like permease